MAEPRGPEAERHDWFDLFRCFRIAVDPAKMWLGFLGAAFTLLMLVLALYLLLEVRQLAGGATSKAALQALRAGDAAVAYNALSEGVAQTWADVKLDFDDVRGSLFSGELMPALERARTIKKSAPWAALILLLLWLPWAYFGGAISRAAAVEYATGERITTAEAREFAAARYGSYLWAPVTAVLGLAALGAVSVLAGLAAAHLIAAAVLVCGALASLFLLVVVKQKTMSSWTGGLVGLAALAATAYLTSLAWDMNVAWLSRIAVVVCFPVLLVLAIPMLLLALVLLFGRGVMTSAISYEGTNAFDAVSRAADYIVKRPWHLAFYALAGAAYGIPCLAVVLFFAIGGFVLAAVMAWLGFGESFAGLYGAVFSPGGAQPLLDRLPGFLLRVFFALVCGFVAGWCVSFIQACRVVSYALLRRRIDLSGPSEVFVDADRAGVFAAPTHSAPDEETPSPQ